MMRPKYVIFICFSVLICSIGFAAEKKDQPFLYDDYALVLEKYVDDNNMVNYKQLKASPEKLDAFILTLNTVEPNNFDKWDEEGKIAFWINAYNGLVLKIIITHYPIKSSFLKSMYYPKNSIQQIDSVWDGIYFPVMGQNMSLNDIENKILRNKFNEPRIHMALVCAAMGCPPLHNEPYVGEKLNSQLDDQARRFLSNPQKFRIDRDNHIIYLSSIFDWFGSDFEKKYAPAANILGQNRKVSAVLNFITRCVDKSDSEYIYAGKYKVNFIKYDWSLNEQQ